jgi:hypothetical protein
MASPRYCDACALRVESGRLVGLRLESRKGREDRFASLGLDVSLNPKPALAAWDAEFARPRR